METIIKNVHMLKPHFTDEQIQSLEHDALQYRKYGRVTFKIISYYPKASGSEITVEVRQDKSPAENYLDAATLTTRTKDLFKPYIAPAIKIFVNAVPYSESNVEVVTPEYIRHHMTVLGVKVKEIVSDTGIDRTNISAWMNGNREMSQPVKAMFYYYFENHRNNKFITELSVSVLQKFTEDALNSSDKAVSQIVDPFLDSYSMYFNLVERFTTNYLSVLNSTNRPLSGADILRLADIMKARKKEELK